MKDLIWFGACCALAGAGIAAYAMADLASGQQPAAWQIAVEAVAGGAWTGTAIWYATGRRSR